MTTTQAVPIAVPSFDRIKMEERKRALAVDVDDLAPSRKRLVKDENGQAMRMDAEKEKDVESFQKDAIMRQMKEYKRQKKDLEEQRTDLLKKSAYHDDHLRAIDAWFAQLLDEVRVLAREALPTPSPSATSTAGDDMYGSALLFENNEQFSQHLHARSASIKSAIADLFSRLPTGSLDVEDLRRALNDALAREKEHVVHLRKALDDQESLNERLEGASYRYMKAEKALDRAKSAQVQKLERQAMGGHGESPTTGKKGGTPVKKEHTDVNGELSNGGTGGESDIAHKDAIATAEKQKLQLEEIEAENDRLTNDLSAARTKLASLSDDDYAETALFKSVKSQYEDIVKRVNDLEATNVQLREEVQKYHAERTSFRSQLDDETRDIISESETQIARAETDLVRIRAIRDELTAELSIRRTADENRRVSADHARELAEARDSRIKSLESELERMKLQLGETASDAMTLDNLNNEALQAKVRTLESQYSLLSNELASMEAAWKKTSALAAKKVEEITFQEENAARLQAEKMKADQKYFAAMKAKDMRDGELRSLKTQNARSSEIVSQLKDTEGKTRELVTNLERQVADSKESLTKINHQHRTLEQRAKEATIATEGLRKQVEELKTLVGGKDKDVLAATKAKREVEVEFEKVVGRLEHTNKQYELLRKTRAADNSASSDDWRKLAICPVCNANIRNTVIKLCGHVFCQACVKDLISNRSRKCPSCGKAFGNGDHMSIVLT